jgi:hypothetical protein
MTVLMSALAPPWDWALMGVAKFAPIVGLFSAGAPQRSWPSSSQATLRTAACLRIGGHRLHHAPRPTGDHLAAASSAAANLHPGHLRAPSSAALAGVIGLLSGSGDGHVSTRPAMPSCWSISHADPPIDAIRPDAARSPRLWMRRRRRGRGPCCVARSANRGCPHGAPGGARRSGE